MPRTHQPFSTAIQGIDVTITVQEPSGQLIYANEAAAQTLGDIITSSAAHMAPVGIPIIDKPLDISEP